MQHADTGSRPGRRIPVDLAQPLNLTIHSPDGAVVVRAVDRSDVLIAYGELGDAEEGDDSGVTIDARGNRIEVRPNPWPDSEWGGAADDFDLENVFKQIGKAFRGGGPFLSARPGKVAVGIGPRSWPDIAVDVPRSIGGRVEIHCASGGARIEDFGGEIALHAMSGDLRAVRTAGALEMRAASGDLMIEEASGRLTADAASGDVRVAASRLDGFLIKTASGDVDVDAMLTGDGPFRAQTANGDVRLTLRALAHDGEAPAADIAFHTVSGGAHVAPPFRQTDRRRWLSGPGDRGPHVEVATVNGDLAATIAAAVVPLVLAPSPAVPPDEPAPTAAQTAEEGGPTTANPGPGATRSAGRGAAARLSVLEAVERGEIDIEEALRQLDGEDAVANP